MLALCLLLSWVVESVAWEVKIVNNTGHPLRYEVYQQSWLGEKIKCSGYYDRDFFAGGTCPLDSFIFPYCPTRVNIYVARNYWGAHLIIIKHWSPAILARSAGTIVLKSSQQIQIPRQINLPIILP